MRPRKRRPSSGPPETPPSVFVDPSLDRRARYVRDAEAEWFALYDAENIIALEELGIAALQGLSTDQLRSLCWVGLLDEGWSRMFAVLDERGESL